MRKNKQPTWRDIAAPIICRVLEENAGKPADQIRKALFEAYPFGERKNHPYRIWLSEIRHQTKPKPKPNPNESLPLFDCR